MDTLFFFRSFADFAVKKKLPQSRRDRGDFFTLPEIFPAEIKYSRDFAPLRANF